jgi:hypothetical protein
MTKILSLIWLKKEENIKFAMVCMLVFNVGWFQVLNIQLLIRLKQQLPILVN